MTGERWTTVNVKVGNIAQMTGLRLTVDHNSDGWRLEEGTDTSGVSTSKFGDRRRTYGPFIEWLDAVILGLILRRIRVEPSVTR